MRSGRLRCLVLSFLFPLLFVGNAIQAAEVTGKVEWVYDGDTVRIAGLGKVRLLGIDTPEKEASERDRFYRRQGVADARLRQMAKAAHRLTIAEAKGRTVRLGFDGEERDKYNRLLAYVYLPDGRLLNRLLLEKGYASVYRSTDFRLKKDFLAAEAWAKERKQGLWN